jgi:hypothetical protein
MKITRAALHAAILEALRAPGKGTIEYEWLSEAQDMLTWLDAYFEYQTDSQGYLKREVA